MIISYAQNREDVLLSRAFIGIEKGFYIDVGANDPLIDSVTMSFYEQGWQGINIEPILSEYKKLVEKRPLDINLNCAVSNKSGYVKILESEIRGLSSVLDKVILKQNENNYNGRIYEVESCTLNDICKNLKNQDIHFIKIDVEGHEKQVLEGIDLKKYRPWIILIESTMPNSIIKCHQEWEYLLLTNEYLFAYDDGINRFYVSNEHKILIEKFMVPINILDNYIDFKVIQYQEEINNLKNELNIIIDKNKQLVKLLGLSSK